MTSKFSSLKLPPSNFPKNQKWFLCVGYQTQTSSSHYNVHLFQPTEAWQPTLGELVKTAESLHNSIDSVSSFVCMVWKVACPKYSSSIVSLRMSSLCITTGWVICFASLMSVSSLFRWYASSIIVIHLCSSLGVLLKYKKEKRKKKEKKRKCYYTTK